MDREFSFVYFIRQPASGLIKIGKSINPGARMREMQVGSGDRLELLGYFPEVPFRREKDIHLRFAKDREAGEWFRPSKELQKFIQDESGNFKGTVLLQDALRSNEDLKDQLHRFYGVTQDLERRLKGMRREWDQLKRKYKELQSITELAE